MAASNMLHHGKPATPSWLRTLLPVILAGSSHSVLALGVGEPQLLSAFGEPLRVRVPVSLDTAGERAAAEAVRSDLVPESDYPRYGVAEQAIDTSAIYAASRADGARAWIEIGSNEPMREPAAILLLRVRLGNTVIVREVPLLFDFKVEAPQAEAPAPATADATVDVTAMPVVPVAAAPDLPAVPAKPRQARIHRPHSPATAKATPAPAASPAMFQLSAGLHYSSASAGLRLAESFDSLAAWQLAHPPVEAPTATVAQAPAPLPQPRLPAPVPAAAPVQAPPARSAQGWGWIGWLPGAAILVAGFLLWRRRTRREPTPQFVATSATVAVAAVSSPAPTPALDEAVAPIRERLRKLSRGSLDQDMARRALLVDAFLDLRRYDSAERLLKELEQDFIAKGEPRPGVASVAAAVR